MQITGSRPKQEAGKVRGTTGITIGLDVSDRFSEAYAIDADGVWLGSWRIPTKPEALRNGL